MPLIYANGGTPSGNNSYTGVSFTDGAGLLTAIQTNLISAGWTLQSSAANVITMKGTSLVNNHNCYVRFSITGGNTLEIRGDQAGDGVTLSTAAKLTVPFVSGSSNALFLTADAEAGCLSIIPSSGTADCFHFGFLDRLDPTDQNAWMVGRVLAGVNTVSGNHLATDTMNGYASAYVSKSKVDSTNWRQLGAVFTNVVSSSWAGSSASFPCGTVFDRTVTDASAGGISATATTNAAYQAWNGGAERATGKPLLSSYYYLEGLTGTGSYGTTPGTQSIPLYYRGNVKYAVTGLASYAAGVQWNTSGSGVYLSGGGIGWQGMKIAA